MQHHARHAAISVRDTKKLAGKQAMQIREQQIPGQPALTINVKNQKKKNHLVLTTEVTL